MSRQNNHEPSGYENEPVEEFLALPADLYCSLFHQLNHDSKEELCFYRDILSEQGCRNILEIGCGTGRICEHLQRAGFNLIGIDISRQMLDFSGSSRHVPRVEMDMTRLGFTPSFDAAIIPCNTLNLLHDETVIRQCLAETRQVLKQSGLLVLQLFVPDQLLIENAGTKLFQFSLLDLRDGGRLIRETIRTYYPDRRTVTLEERYKIRDFFTPGASENYSQSFQLAAFPLSAWLEIISGSGFTPVATHGHFNQSPFVETSDSTLLLVAQKSSSP